MPARVADASVLAAIAFGEPRSAEAMRLLNGAELWEPRLLPFELASVALKKARKDPGRAAQLARALRLALGLDVRWVDVDLAEALDLALDLGLTTYDASYLWVARSVGASLVTFDLRLRQAARRRR